MLGTSEVTGHFSLECLFILQQHGGMEGMGGMGNAFSVEHSQIQHP